MTSRAVHPACPTGECRRVGVWGVPPNPPGTLRMCPQRLAQRQPHPPGSHTPARTPPCVDARRAAPSAGPEGCSAPVETTLFPREEPGDKTTAWRGAIWWLTCSDVHRVIHRVGVGVVQGVHGGPAAVLVAAFGGISRSSRVRWRPSWTSVASPTRRRKVRARLMVRSPRPVVAVMPRSAPVCPSRGPLLRPVAKSAAAACAAATARTAGNEIPPPVVATSWWRTSR